MHVNDEVGKSVEFNGVCTERKLVCGVICNPNVDGVNQNHLLCARHVFSAHHLLVNSRLFLLQFCILLYVLDFGFNKLPKSLRIDHLALYIYAHMYKDSCIFIYELHVILYWNRLYENNFQRL